MVVSNVLGRGVGKSFEITASAGCAEQLLSFPRVARVISRSAVSDARGVLLGR